MASRTVLFEVRVVDKNAQESIPATITPFNDAPAFVEDIELRSTFETILVDFTVPEDLDFSGILVWMDTTSGFIPSDSNLVADSKGAPISLDADPDTTYYLRIAAYDAFSKDPDDLNISLERSITTLAVDTTSGAFSESLTVSGLPVLTDASLGSITLQRSYDNGTGIIATTAGKPVVISGSSSDALLDFKVVGSGVVENRDFTLRNPANANATLIIDSGLTSPAQQEFEFRDRGESKWFFGRSTGNAVFWFNTDSLSTPFFLSQPASAGVGDALFATTAAGNVGIGTFSASQKLHVVGSGIVTGKLAVGSTTVSGGAVAQFTSTTGGVLFPQMTTTQRDTISNPPNGSVIYNITTNKLQVRAAGAWVDLH